MVEAYDLISKKTFSEKARAEMHGLFFFNPALGFAQPHWKKFTFLKPLSIFTLLSRLMFLVFLTFIFNSCAVYSGERIEKADAIGAAGGFQRSLVSTNPFVLTAYSRLRKTGEMLNVYIEGDGYAWVTPTRISGDPTPRSPMLLSIAERDSAANVVYLARPCQYTSFDQDPQCQEKYWTTKRFSNEVIQSVNQAVSHFASQAQASKINLIGYSGGATVALLIASERKDVSSLKTIAGNLDPVGFNHYHGVSPVELPKNPLEIAFTLKNIPQIHFIGKKDRIIPPMIAEHFLEASVDTSCIQTILVPDAEHAKGWVEKAQSILLEQPSCKSI